MSEIMYPYPKKMYPTKEDILYNIEEGIISKEVGEELIKQIESLPKYEFDAVEVENDE